MRFPVLAMSLGFVSACQSQPPPKEDLADFVSRTSEIVSTPVPAEIQKVVRHNQEVFADEMALAEHADEAEVHYWVRRYTQQERERFERFLSRGAPYRATVEAILERAGLPKDLYYLALIESGFSVKARSRAGAVGMWQFMPGTAKRYQLAVNPFVDERQDPIRATVAAANYLSDLHNVFSSWPLALAAYNSGEGRVVGAVMRAKSRNFWHIARQSKVPAETRDYVPKFIAAALIGRNPSRYGLKTPALAPLPELTATVVPSPVRLQDVSRALDIPLKDLERFNPNLRRGVTDPFQPRYRIWIPSALSSRHLQRLAHLPKAKGLPKVHPERWAKAQRSRGHQSYRIREGDTLGGIARKFQTSIATLKKANRLKGNRIYVGRQLQIPRKTS